MKIEKTIHRNVKPDGTFTDKLGAVETKGVIRMSKGEGCGLENCKCSEGYWLTVCLPRTKAGIVECTTTFFHSKKEMDEFLTIHEKVI